MSNSFARFLSDEELLQVRELYLQSMAEVDEAMENADGDPGSVAPSPDN